MSVINQVLLNLEKRGANLAELEVLPDHVQLLSESARNESAGARHWGWVAAGVAFVVAAPMGWIAFKAMVAEPTYSPMASGAEGVKVISAFAGENRGARPDERGHAYLQETGVFRLSSELSSLPPADPAPHRGTAAPQLAVGIKDPLSSARLLGRKGAESATDKTQARPAAPGRKTASAAAALAKPAVKVIATPPEIRKKGSDSTPSKPADQQNRKAVARAESARDETRAGPAAPGRKTASAATALAEPTVKVIATPPEIPKKARGSTPRKLADHQYRKAVARTESATDKTRIGPAAPGRKTASAGAPPVKPDVKIITLPPEIRKKVRDPTPRELADHEYRKAVALLDQDRPAEAESGLRKTLKLYPTNQQARQVLVGLLVQGRRLGEAERVLEEGVKISPAQTGFNLTLARLQAHRGDNVRAIATLQNGLKYARSSAEYAAFLATLLQRQGKHEEAIKHFQAALRLRPSFGVWWVGLGVSLQAANQPDAAMDAYRRARATGNLHPHVAALAEQRLQQLQ